MQQIKPHHVIMMWRKVVVELLQCLQFKRL